MTKVFISHAKEDEGVAVRIAENLEDRGYSTWYYQRDSQPAITHLSQTGRAIKESESFLLLITESSLKSNEVNKEVAKAHGENRPIVPVRVKVSDQQFREVQPDWDMIIGTVVTTEISQNVTENVVTRILKALDALGVQPSNEPVAAESNTRTMQDRWLADASQIDIGHLGGIVFKTPLVEWFLNGDTKFFLSANKGLGKTLLLRYKRSLLADQYRDHQRKKSNVFFIPENAPYLDLLDDLDSIPGQHQKFLEDVVNAKRLWSFALRVSALSHHSLLVSEKEPELKTIDQRLTDWMTGTGKVVPTSVFCEILSRPVSAINKIMDGLRRLLDQRFRQIHSATHMFIDQVDHGLRHLTRKAWIAIQAGLINAAWDLWSTNNHVKIYASIRQEAYSNSESDVSANFSSAVTNLEYTKDELIELLDQLSRTYEGKSFKQFIGRDSITHPARREPEDSFDFVHRHTFGRPRDLVIISASLSERRTPADDAHYRRTVGEASSSHLAGNIFAEMRVFLDSLNNESRRRKFLSMLPSNILTRKEAESIYCRFNDIATADFGAIDPHADQYDHPFWEMYSAGLLGILSEDLDSQRMVQEFKQPHDMIHDSQSALPNVDYYFIHPSLDRHIRNLSAGSYHVFQHIPVGHLCPWESYYSIVHEIERALFSIPDRQIRDATYQSLKHISEAVYREDETFLHSMHQQGDAWQDIRRLLSENANDKHANLLFWLEELTTSLAPGS